MFRVSGNQISITAGDTALMAICPDETGYVPTANDRAIFTVRERPKRRALIEKTIAPEADGRFVVCFESEDTARLKPREYVWDVRLAIQANVDENGEVTDAEQIITPCPPGILFVMAAIGELSSAANNGFGQPVNQTLRIRFEKLMQGPRGEPGRDGRQGRPRREGRQGRPRRTGRARRERRKGRTRQGWKPGRDGRNAKVYRHGCDGRGRDGGERYAERHGGKPDGGIYDSAGDEGRHGRERREGRTGKRRAAGSGIVYGADAQ